MPPHSFCLSARFLIFCSDTYFASFSWSFYSLALIWWVCSPTLLNVPWFHLSSSTSGKQAPHKNPEEYTEPSVEWNAGVSWHHSSRHDHQNAQVGAQLCISLRQPLALLPSQPNAQFVMQRMEIHASNPNCQQPSMLPNGIFQVTHYYIWTTLPNCSTCHYCGNFSGVCCAVGVRPPLLPTAHSTWSDWGQA